MAQLATTTYVNNYACIYRRHPPPLRAGFARKDGYRRFFFFLRSSARSLALLR
ncbi:hypothetical protein VT84_14875 [Gemmata sp. SH-PL17]|nr:hypothetical protein VT84_14875 [Gemmata sp. SH-PL17]